MAHKAMGKDKEAAAVLSDLIKLTTPAGPSQELFQPEPSPYRSLAAVALSDLNAPAGERLDAE
jgi:hypothetical protein